MVAGERNGAFFPFLPGLLVSPALMRLDSLSTKRASEGEKGEVNCCLRGSLVHVPLLSFQCPALDKRRG